MSTSDYTVGYGKPPKHTQFQPGESGNPAGRPKGLKNLATDLEEELGQKITVTEGGVKSEITKQRAMLKALAAKAMSGDTRAATCLITLIVGIEQSRATLQDKDVLDPDDAAILAAYRERVLAELK